MITIKSLSKEECEMLDIMYNLDSMEDYKDWLSSLTEEDQELAVHLEDLLMQAVADEMIGEDTSANRQAILDLL